LEWAPFSGPTEVGLGSDFALRAPDGRDTGTDQDAGLRGAGKVISDSEANGMTPRLRGLGAVLQGSWIVAPGALMCWVLSH